MENQFKAQDSVQLLHGYTPTMTISQIDEEKQMAHCVWYDTTKTRTIKQEWLPLSVLKHTPERTTIDPECFKRALQGL